MNEDDRMSLNDNEIQKIEEAVDGWNDLFKDIDWVIDFREEVASYLEKKYDGRLWFFRQFIRISV